MQPGRLLGRGGTGVCANACLLRVQLLCLLEEPAHSGSRKLKGSAVSWLVLNRARGVLMQTATALVQDAVTTHGKLLFGKRNG